MILINACMMHTLRVSEKNIMTGNASCFFVYLFASSVLLPPSQKKKQQKIKEKMTEVPECRSLIVTNYGPA